MVVAAGGAVLVAPLEARAGGATGQANGNEGEEPCCERSGTAGDGDERSALAFRRRLSIGKVAPVSMQAQARSSGHPAEGAPLTGLH